MSRISSRVLLDLMNMQNIQLNSDILNEFLFSRIEFLRLFGDIVSIEKGLLKSFKRLKSIHIDLLSIGKLMHRGIDWIFDLNSQVNVDIQNVSLPSGFDESICVNLIIYSLNEQLKNVDVNLNKHFPDEDFCLYARIPIRQMVFIRLYLSQLHDTDYSCTYLFLIRNMRILFYFCKDMDDDHLMNINDQLNTFSF